jgi:glucose-1-phosphate adenylyltransferase
MDYSQMVEAHIQSGAAATVAANRQPITMSDQFGVIDVEPNDRTRIRQFLEKPTDPTPLADNPDEILASMGNYVFDAKALVDQVTKDADAEDTKHDMGGDIMPAFAARGEAAVYDFKDNTVPGAEDRDKDYWRDVGTMDSYYEAHQDLVAVQPVFNLYNYEWPIFTDVGPYPPAKFVHGWHGRVGSAVNSIVSPGVVVSGALVETSVMGPGTKIHSWATVTDSVLLDGVEIGRHAVVRRAIIDKNVVIPENARIGLDPEEDRARGLTVTDSGLVVIGKGQTVQP